MRERLQAASHHRVATGGMDSAVHWAVRLRRPLRAGHRSAVRRLQRRLRRQAHGRALGNLQHLLRAEAKPERDRGTRNMLCRVQTMSGYG